MPDGSMTGACRSLPRFFRIAHKASFVPETDKIKSKDFYTRLYSLLYTFAQQDVQTCTNFFGE